MATHPPSSGPDSDGRLPPAQTPSLPSASSQTQGQVCPLDVEPELAAGLSESERAQARRLLLVPDMRVTGGAWSPADGLSPAVATLVLSGVLMRQNTAFGRATVQVFGPGDLLDGRVLAGRDGAWRAIVPARLAVFHDSFFRAASRWPAVIAGLTRKLFDAREQEHTIAAITALPRVEERLLALFCHLAGRWGQVTPDGVTVILPVTHTLLGELTGSRRPTVSLALRTLKDQRLLDRLPDGRWRLPPNSLDWAINGFPPIDRTATAT